MLRVACLLRVRGQDGNPLTGIRFVVEEAAGPVPEIVYVTGATGEVQLGLWPGRVVLRFFLRNEVSRTVSLAIVAEPKRIYDVVVDEPG